jgi:hypothetical protein
MSLKNTLIKFLVAFVGGFRKKTSAPAPSQKFLIVSTTGLGDTLWGTPAIRTLRFNFSYRQRNTTP